MFKFNDFIKEAKLSDKQKKIAKLAGDEDKIDADDLKALRGGAKLECKEEVQIDEGKMKELSMDLTDMGHDEFRKKYGNPKSHYDPSNFKKPVQPGHEMDRAKALAQRGVQSLNKEEVEHLAEADLAAIKAEYKKNTDDNRHTENAVLLAKHFGSKSDQNKAAKAKAYRDKANGYGSDPLGRHYSKMAHEVHSKLYHHIDEQVEQIDELSKGTLANYAQKAAHDVGNKMHSAGHDRGIAHAASIAGKDKLAKSFGKSADVDHSKALTRLSGIKTAAKKLAKEEVEQIDETMTRKHFQQVADVIKSHPDQEKRNELAKHHAEIFKQSNPRFDHSRFYAAAGANIKEEVQVAQEESPYLKATLQVMDEGKVDDLRDAQSLRKANQSAYSKNYKPDTSHPHVKVVKGTAYGGAAQKDDETDEKPDNEKQEKRGRGRPAGKVGKYKARGSKSAGDDWEDREFKLHV